jgi:hypothetical protein
MANKALAKRQKLSLQTVPSRKGLKPRNPVAIAAKKRAAGSHQKTFQPSCWRKRIHLRSCLPNPTRITERLTNALAQPPVLAGKPESVAMLAGMKLAAAKKPEAAPDFRG